VLHAFGVLPGPEDGHGDVAWGAEGFEAFVALHAVVEGGGHAVEAEERVLDEFWSGPLAGFGGVAGFDMAIHCEEEEL
jgi:hypothetical protein